MTVVKLLYFAWIRSRIGLSQETVPLPVGISDVAGLLDWLKDRGPGYADALANLALVKVAVNQEFADFSQPLTDSDEVALFPPVTGG
jgi:sulfur-carrier protein